MQILVRAIVGGHLVASITLAKTMCAGFFTVKFELTCILWGDIWIILGNSLKEQYMSHNKFMT